MGLETKIDKQIDHFCEVNSTNISLTEQYFFKKNFDCFAF